MGAIAAALKASRQKASVYLGQDPGTKVCLWAPDGDYLEHLYAQSLTQGLPAYLVTDSGHVLPPHFTGAPIVTALGIGPATREETRHLLKKLRLT